MKIDKRLNLTFPLQDEFGNTLHVHSTPVAFPVFQKYFLLMSKAFSAMYQEGLSVVGGPRVAAMMLRQLAEDQGPEVLADLEKNLLAEIKRLTNVLAPLPNGGYDMMPLDDALKGGLISEEDFSEAEGQITFFTLASHMHKRATLRPILEHMAGMWGQEITSLNATEYMNSLPISTTGASTGETTPEQVPLSSVPH